jgi:hypothetical protein
MSKDNATTILTVFSSIVSAIRTNQLIHRESKQDKEFHFQNWVRERLESTGYNYEVGGRNSYPDFRMVRFTEGYEVKGLAYPGREVTYDCNSQVPTGSHNGRTIFYVFGRYPAEPDGDIYPVLDIVVCHGDFLNADHDYTHKNKSIKGFGTYGDIMIRDRKMYVAPTPFGLLSGVAHTQTLVLPKDFIVKGKYKQVGEIIRKEAERIIVGYSFDLKTNTLVPKSVKNRDAGREHVFYVWRIQSGATDPVFLKENVESGAEGAEDGHENV